LQQLYKVLRYAIVWTDDDGAFMQWACRERAHEPYNALPLMTNKTADCKAKCKGQVKKPFDD